MSGAGATGAVSASSDLAQHAGNQQTEQTAPGDECPRSSGLNVNGYIARARKSPRLTEMFDHFGRLAIGSDGLPSSLPSLDPALFEYDVATLRYSRFREKYAGPFNWHFVASVPYALEEQCRLGAGLLSYCGSISGTTSVYTLGDGPGVTARTLANISAGQIRTLNCSPNPENYLAFYSNRPNGSYLFTGPFFELTPKRRSEVGGGVFQDRFDVIIEDTTFQMYGKERAEPIALALRHLKSDGLFILIEKLTQSDAAEFIRRELQKDEEFKSRYFSRDAIGEKRRKIVSQMDSQLVSLGELAEAVSYFLRYCVTTWNSGNFYTLAASNSRSRLQRFTDKLIAPAVPPEFLYEKLPAVVIPQTLGSPVENQYRFRRAER